jgi:hypothetical protein
VRWLYANLGYKLVAVGVAFLLWGVAHSSSSIERGFDVPMVLRGLPDDLVIVEQSTGEVNVRIQGSRAALRNLSPGDLEYPIEVSGAKPGVLKVEVDPAPLELPRGARVVSRSPSVVELTLAPRGKTVRAADLSGEPAPASGGAVRSTLRVNHGPSGSAPVERGSDRNDRRQGPRRRGQGGAVAPAAHVARGAARAARVRIEPVGGGGAPAGAVRTRDERGRRPAVRRTVSGTATSTR